MTHKRNIKGKIVHAAVYSRTLAHFKHYRGAGVHSPFVYGVIRNAIMKRTPESRDKHLYDELRSRGFSNRRAAQLQNLYSYHNYTSAPFAENDAELPPLDAGTLCFVMPDLTERQTILLAEKAVGTGCTLCFICPYGTRKRLRLARKITAAHRHTSVDNRGFLLLFYNERLPKQHFKL